MGNDSSSDSGNSSGETVKESMAICMAQNMFFSSDLEAAKCLIGRQGERFMKEWAADMRRSDNEAKESQQERIQEIMNSYERFPFSGVSSGGSSSSSSDYPDRDSESESYDHCEYFRTKYKLARCQLAQRSSFAGGRIVLADVPTQSGFGHRVNQLRCDKRAAKVSQLNGAFQHEFGNKTIIDVACEIAAEHFPYIRAADIRDEVTNYTEGCVYSFCGTVDQDSVTSTCVSGPGIRYALVRLLRKTLWNTAKRKQAFPVKSAEASAFLRTSERVINSLLRVR